MGTIVYSTVYFAFPDPVLFTCFFDQTPHKYVGMKVEDFELEGRHIESYYFVGVLDNEVRSMETHPGVLRSIFQYRPVWWCNIHDGEPRWETHKGAFPYYLPSTKTTLR